MQDGHADQLVTEDAEGFFKLAGEGMHLEYGGAGV